MEINYEIPYNRILSRLGYRKSTSSVLSCRLDIIRNVIEEAASHISLKGTYSIFPFTPAENGILLSTGDLITGTLPSRLPETASSVMVMAATSGREITGIIGELQKENMEKAVIFDAAASEITDCGLDWLVKYAGIMLKRENRAVSRKRFSPGYGDFSLETQRIFHRLLNLESLDIKLSESCILIPEKSVIAVTGVN